MRRIISRGALGLNIASTIKNLTQGVNTYAVLGEKYTIMGYYKAMKYFALKEVDPEIQQLLAESFVQDRRISATKKMMQKVDDVLFSNWDITEKMNRIPAYFGAKAKYINEHPKATMEEANSYARELVRKTQFAFDSIDMPVALAGDVAKTLLQFQTYTVKQIEFVVAMAKNKDLAGIARLMAGSAIMYYSIGQLLNMEPKDFVPGSRLVEEGGITPPPVKMARDVYGVLTNAPNKYGQVSKEDLLGRIMQSRDLKRDAATIIPGGTQALKTYEGIKALTEGKVKTDSGKGVRFNVKSTPTNILLAPILGKYNTKEGRKYIQDLKDGGSKKKKDDAIDKLFKFLKIK